MPRVAAQDVRDIFPETDQEDRALAVHIETANNLVTDELSDADYSDARLRDIERYLAAHFAAVTAFRVGTLEQDRAGEAEQYYPKLGESLKLTRYGQQVLILDTSSILANLGKKRARFSVFGADST